MKWKKIILHKKENYFSTIFLVNVLKSTFFGSFEHYTGKIFDHTSVNNYVPNYRFDKIKSSTKNFHWSLSKLV